MASDGATIDNFGSSISIYKNTIAVGSYGDNSSAGNNNIIEICLNVQIF